MNLRANCIAIATFLIGSLVLEGADRSTFTVDQQLVVAAFELDVKKVDSLLKGGALI